MSAGHNNKKEGGGFFFCLSKILKKKIDAPFLFRPCRESETLQHLFTFFF